MLKVLFFARIKEELNCPGVDVHWEDTVADLDSLQARLCRDGGPLWQEVLNRANVVRAVNQCVVAANIALNDGDEVAFFPPVTGG